VRRSARFRACVVPFTVSLLALELGAGIVLAAEHERQPKVVVQVSSCSPPFEAALRRMLALELGELFEDARPATATNPESIAIACQAEIAKISARSVAGDQVAHNDLRFDAFPSDVAARAVALAALEALRAVDPTLTERLAAQRAEGRAGAGGDAPARAPATESPRETDARSALAQKPRSAEKTARAEGTLAAPPSTERPVTRLTFGVGARHFVTAPATTLLGVRLELSRRFSAPFDAGLDLDGALNRQQVSLGTVEARLLSTGAWLAARAGSADWSASAGLGGRVGLVRLEGAPDREARGHSVLRPLVGALVMLRADGAVGTVALAIAGEGGYALAGAQGLASGAPAVSLDGLWLAISANAGVRLSL
jgi:hypothetical protein